MNEPAVRYDGTLLPAEFYEGNAFLGSGFAPYSEVFVCPLCGDAWGRIHTRVEYFTRRAYCPDHWPELEFAPPLFTDKYPLPKVVLIRDFLVIDHVKSPS